MRLPIRIVQVCSSFVQRNSLSLTRKSKPEMSGQEGVLIMKLRRSLQCAAIAVGCLVATQLPAHAQAITSFDPPGSIGTFPSSINDAGEIVCQGVTNAGELHACLAVPNKGAKPDESASPLTDSKVHPSVPENIRNVLGARLGIRRQ